MSHKHTMGYYSAFKREETLIHATTRLKLEAVMLSEISQSQKDKYCRTSPYDYLEQSNS